MISSSFNYTTPYSKVANFTLAIFIIAYCGMYYAEFLSFIWFAYVLLAIVSCIRIIKFKTLANKWFISHVTIFIAYSWASILWAESPDYAYESVIQLTKIYVVVLMIASLLDNRRSIHFALLLLAISGLIYGYLYITHVDIASLAYQRVSLTEQSANDDLPNLNVVTLCISFSCIYFIYEILFIEYKRQLKIILLICAGIGFFYLCILGSRKSLMAVGCAIIFFFFAGKWSMRIKIGLIIISLINIALAFLPESYVQFVFDRFTSLSFGQSGLDKSDQIRVMALESGIDYFLSNPVFGVGFYNFSVLFNQDTGINIYAHNNFIETAADLGIIGFYIYYSILWKVLKDCIKRNMYSEDRMLIFSLIVALLFNGLFIVYLMIPFVWVLIAILYALSQSRYHNQCI